MDKFKNVTKGGWHPGGDRPIHRDTWKSDLKGIATGKKADPYAAAREHQSRPLSSLKDPDSFGPPPKHTGAHGPLSGPSDPPSSSRAGLGSLVPRATPATTSRYAQQEEEESDAAPPPSLPYRANTTGLRTDNLPKPPVRRPDAAQSSGSPVRTASPALPPRRPQRPPQAQAAAPPSLPPRQNEYPDEYTPAPPPPYNEAVQGSNSDPAYINQGAASRLGQAGVSIPGLGIGPGSNSNSAPSPVRGPQLSELQERFARMNAGNQSPASPVVANNLPASQKKAPPPPPPKKANLTSSNQQTGSSSSGAGAGLYDTPPPLPLSSKPRPT